MDLNSIVGGILSSWIFRLLSLGWAIVGPIMIAKLKTNKSRWEPVVRTGFFAFLATVGLAIAFQIYASTLNTEAAITGWVNTQATKAEEEKKKLVTLDNIGTKIHEWVATSHFSIKDNKDEHPLSLEVGTRNLTVSVFRPVDRPTFLAMAHVVAVSPPHLAALKRLSLAERERFKRALETNLAIAGGNYAITSAEGIPLLVRLEVRMPINENMNEAIFLNGIHQVDSLRLLALDNIISEVESPGPRGAAPLR